MSFGARYVLSCDPGAKGYFCRISVDTLKVEFFPIPSDPRSYVSRDKKTGEKKLIKYRVINRKALRGLVDELVTSSVLFTTIEHQQAYPGRNGKGQGHVSTGRHLFGYGYLLALMEGTNSPIEEVRPVSWKAKLGLIRKNKHGEPPLSQYKKKCLAWELAASLYPELLVKGMLLPKTSSFDRSDSLLINHYALHVLGKRYGIVNDADYLEDEPVLL